MNTGTHALKMPSATEAVDDSQPAGDGHQPPAGDHTFFGYGNGGVPPMLRVCSEARAGRATPRTAWRNISMAAERTTALGPSAM